MAHSVSLVLLLLGASWAPSSSPPADPMRVVRAAVPRHWPPQYITDGNGEPDGFAIEILEAVAARRGLRIEYQVEDNFHLAVQALRDGDVDLVPNMGILDERAREFLLTSPTETFAVSLFVRSESLDIPTRGDLLGRRLAVVRGNVAAHLVKREEATLLGFRPDQLKTKVFEDVRSALFELLAGEVDGLIYPEPVIRKLAADAGLDHRIRRIGEPLFEVKRGIAVRRDRPELFQEIQAGLDELLSTPAYQQIYTKWYANEPPFWSSSLVLALVGLVTSVTAIGFALVHYRSTVDANSKLRIEVAERGRAEAAARESESKCKAVMEQAGDAIFVADDAGRIVDANEIACELCGLSRSALIGKHGAEIFAPDDLEARPLHLEDVKAGKRVVLERKLRRDDGTLVPVEVNAKKVWEGRHVVIVRDLTERKNVEERFRRIEKTQAVGRLAGGIAHDFNNLLTAINGFSEVVLSKLPVESPLRQDVEQVSKAGQRAALLTGQLLAFSRQQVRQARVLDPNAVVADMDAMLQRLIGEKVELLTILGSEMGRVEVDPGHLEQVILNLVLNARDAMPAGGRLEIETRNVELGDDFVASRPGLMPGRHVLLEVRDDGTGMDDATRERIFEPFFTTKPDGKGTGLGLSTVYGIIEQNGGYTEVESAPSTGTTFRIYLPSRGAAEEPNDEPAASTPGGSETILIVEDEVAVRRYLVRILGELGYRLVEASCGVEALERFGLYDGAPVRLLITDVVMPNMGGEELADRLLEQAPELKVLFMSGYTGRDVEALDRFERDTAFLQKPFLPHVVAQRVRELLDGAGDSQRRWEG